jgi:hypothetical protein
MQARPNKGRLPGNIPEPSFVADSNHRCKVLTGEFHQLLAQKVATRQTLTKNYVTRLGKNFGYMIQGLHNLNNDEGLITEAGVSVLDHHFDDHTLCGDWCPRKRMTQLQLQQSKHFYRCKEVNAKLYATLSVIMGHFVALDRLIECLHGMDTQANESFNNTISWVAPKNKVYCGSSSLTN